MGVNVQKVWRETFKCLLTRSGLKRHLEQDFRRVNKKRKLEPFPPPVNVVSALEGWIVHKAEEKLQAHEKQFGRPPFNSYRSKDEEARFERITDSQIFFFIRST